MPPDFVKNSYGLTPAEIRIVLQLLSGKSLRDSALVAGVSYETARSVLKSVFVKTGTHRQSELVLLLSRTNLLRKK